MARIILELTDVQMVDVNNTATSLGVGTVDAVIWMIDQHKRLRSQVAGYQRLLKTQDSVVTKERVVAKAQHQKLKHEQISAAMRNAAPHRAAGSIRVSRNPHHLKKG